MLRIFVALSLLFSFSPLVAQPTPASLKLEPAARELFERDWVLTNWALKHFDTDGDLLLQPEELRAAAEMFRNIADTNHDGRITPQEYAAAREEILKRD